MNTGSEIDLTKTTRFFRNISKQTEDYIVGSVIPPGYEEISEFKEGMDIQVYIHKEGWIVAYLLAYQPASMIFDWSAYKSSGSTLEKSVKGIARGMGFSGDTQYYDFRDQTATNLMLIADMEQSNRDNFTLEIPLTVAVSEASWSHAGYNVFNSKFMINDDEVSGIKCNNCWGLHTAQIELAPQVVHNMHMDHDNYIGGGNGTSYGGIALIYREGQ